MDIIDIMLAKALTPQGQTDIYVNKANKAAAKAAQAEQDAAAAIATVEAAADTIASAQEEAADLLEAAQEALQTAEAAQINMPEAYSITGQNTDGYMTQKAVTDALAQKQPIGNYATTTEMNTALAAKADKSYVDNAISHIPSGGGSSATINFSPDDAGQIVVIDENGHLVPGDIDESEMIEALLRSGTYTLKNAVGLDIDYANKNMRRIQNAEHLSMGTDFDHFTMYGGRMRCNVADDGTINAFYGDNNYREDGSNGQVMIYQPKFYYQRTPSSMDQLENGKAIRHETLILSATKQIGFKLAPIFQNGEEELDYVLLSAYEGSINDNRLSSIANAKPIGYINIADAESAATARGTGWHITNIAAEATNQMLEIVEFGMMNGQSALELGICNINGTVDVNCSSLTGSTSKLGNASGHAEYTINENNGNTTQETINGKRAISYRGMENPWGNMWRMIGGVTIFGNGRSYSGTPYICTDYNYTTDTISDNYESVGFSLPITYGWINAMGYGNEKYDWVFLPVDCASVANSLLPVGDNLWTVAYTNENRILAIGGSYNMQENNGPFYYAADRAAYESARYNYSARLMYIPTKNNIYTANINKWNNVMGR